MKMIKTRDTEKGPEPIVLEPIDNADRSAVGGHLEDLPSGYYHSPRFIGSLIGVVLMANSLYLGFVLPVCQTSCF